MGGIKQLRVEVELSIARKVTRNEVSQGVITNWMREELVSPLSPVSSTVLP